MDTLVKDLEKNLEPYFKDKAPQLPKKWRELLVKYLPLLTLLNIVMVILYLILRVTLSGFLVSAPYPVPGRILPLGIVGFIFFVVLNLVSLYFLIRAYPLIKKTKYEGWMYLFKSSVVLLVGLIVSFEWLNAIISGALSFYLLFQIKSYYK